MLFLRSNVQEYGLSDFPLISHVQLNGNNTYINSHIHT